MSTNPNKKTTICFAGDLYLKSRDELRSVVDGSLAAYLNDADACFINFASPVTGFRRSYTQYTPSIKRDVNCSAPDVLADFPSVFPKGVVSVANDHLGDRGSVGIIDTLENLEEQGVPFVGGGRFPHEELRYKVIGDDIKVGVIAVLGQTFGIQKFVNKIGPLRERRHDDIVGVIHELREKCDYVVMIYHGGYRYTTVAEPDKRAVISSYLKEGVDAVVAHHPHRLQKPEIADGKYVFYSIGDFYMTERADVMNKPMEGVILKLEFTENGVEPHLECLDINEDGVRLAGKAYEPSYITSAGEYKSAWASEAAEYERIIETYKDYNRRWKLNIYKSELERIDRVLGLIDKNRDAAKLEGIEGRLNDIKGILERKTAFIYNNMSESTDIDDKEFNDDRDEKSASQGIL